ncbi:MAG: acetyl-CoA carboxylase biotin carboxyl carrier protein [Gemmatimonadales bacterium]|jgi:acetyl-CoA carboxylase biotin carboxyl carrier protein
MTDLALLKELLALLDASSATTIEIRRGFTTYRVSREVGGAVVMPAGAVHHAAAPGLAQAASPAGASPAEAAAPATRLVEVKSPMVGTFYRAPEPGADPYVKPGTRVSTGQTLCIIEAMKIMNELESEVAGVVREILVEDAQPVEFGQVLFRVDPNG